MLKYKHIFFDLDDTLWDFYTNANEALSVLFEKYKLEDHALESQELQEVFHSINNELWVLYRNNKIDKDYLRERRFNLIFEKLENTSFTQHSEFGKEYLMLCPTRKNLIEGAEEILQYLKTRYHLHVITNGFEEVAEIKLECSGLKGYFSEVITSERAMFKKPAVEIFEYALQRTSARKAESLMVGNDAVADILGAQRAGIDQVFLNPEQQVIDVEATYEIKSLRELMRIL